MKKVIIIIVIFTYSQILFAQYNEYILRLKSITSTEQSEKLIKKIPKIKKFRKFKKFKKFKKFNIIKINDSDTSEILKVLKKSKIYQYIEKTPIYKLDKINYQITPNDNLYPMQWWAKSFIDNKGSINLDSAWSISVGDTNLIIADLDGAFWINNKDFGKNIWTNKNEIPNNNIDDDSNGLIDDINGWNFIDSSNMVNGDTTIHSPSLFHGAAVTNILSANMNDSFGVAGINKNSKLMPLRIFNQNEKTSFDAILNACEYAIKNKAKIINMSFGASTYSQSFQEIIDTLHANKIIVVASTGNDSLSNVSYPAKYKYVIATGASDQNNQRATFSNFGDSLDFLAPGVNIPVTEPWSDKTYLKVLGTSFSSPIVAGVISLMLSVDPSLTYQEIYTILKKSSQDKIGNPNEDTTGYDHYYGWGKINANKALILTKKRINHKPIANISDLTIAKDSILSYNISIEDKDNDSTESILIGDTLIINLKNKKLESKNIEYGTYKYSIMTYDRVDTNIVNFSLKVNYNPYIYGDVYSRDTIFKGDSIQKIITYGDNDDSILTIIPTLIDSSSMTLNKDILTFKAYSDGNHTFESIIKDPHNAISNKLHWEFYVKNNNTTRIISQLQNYKQSSIFPNPSIKFINFSNPSKKIVLLYDKFNNLIAKTNSNKINMQNLPEGFYFIKIDSKRIKFYNTKQ